MIEPNMEEIGKIVMEHNDPQDIFYDRYVGKRKESSKTLWFKFWQTHQEWLHVLEHDEIQGHIIDFGCGSGHSDFFLTENGLKVHGVDYSPTGIDICNYLRSLQSNEIQERTSFECLNITGPIQPRKHKYDSVWSSHTFEHIVDPSAIFDALDVLTKPGAYMLISVPFADNYNHPTHVHQWFSTKDFDDFLSQFVEVVWVRRNGACMRAMCRLNA